MYKEFLNAIKRRVDTCKTKINAAETDRVISQTFIELYETLKNSPLKFLALLLKGLELAAKKCDKK